MDPAAWFERARSIARAAPRARLRLDANRSWPRERTLALLATSAELPIDYVEEPCLDAHELLAGALPCPIALDESLVSLDAQALATALRSRSLAAVVLKPTLLGGLHACLALAVRARAANVAPIVSHALEGAIGTAACVALALAIGGDAAVGLAPHPALAAWHVSIPQLGPSSLHRGRAPGLGFAIELDAPVQAS